jgi:hypothetical protein
VGIFGLSVFVCPLLGVREGDKMTRHHGEHLGSVLGGERIKGCDDKQWREYEQSCPIVRVFERVTLSSSPPAVQLAVDRWTWDDRGLIQTELSD